jgi:hypothetical protein
MADTTGIFPTKQLASALSLLLCLGAGLFSCAHAADAGSTFKVAAGEWKGRVESGGMWLKIGFRANPKIHQLVKLHFDTGCVGSEKSLMSWAPQDAKVPVAADGSFEYSGEVAVAKGKFIDERHAQGSLDDLIGADFQCAQGGRSHRPNTWSANADGG